MRFILRNERDLEKVLILTQGAWYGLLDLAEEYGWNPLGTVVPGGWVEAGFNFYPDQPDEWNQGYTPQEERLVVFEDALNMAEALERAFIEYEPKYVDWFFQFPTSGLNGKGNGQRFRPGIGVILEVAELCRQGSFVIERL